MIVAREESLSEMPVGSEHLLQNRRPRGFGVAPDGFSDFRQETVEGTFDLLGRSLSPEKLRGLADETMKIVDIPGRSFRYPESDIDVLSELAQQKR